MLVKQRTSKTHSRRRFGGAVLEMVLILPVLLYLAFGTVEFGYFFYVKHSLEGAARDGARAAIPSSAVYSDITSAVDAAMQAANLSSSGYTIQVKDGSTVITTLSSCVAGDTITVTVTCTWGTAGAGYRPWGLIGTAKQVIGSAVMRKEG